MVWDRDSAPFPPRPRADSLEFPLQKNAQVGDTGPMGKRVAAVLCSFSAGAALLAAPPTGAAELQVDASIETIDAIDDNPYGYYDLDFSEDLSTAAYFAYDFERGTVGDLFVVDVAADTKRVVPTPTSPTDFEQLVGLSSDGSTALIWADWEGVETGDADAGFADAFMLDTATGNIELLTGSLPDVSIYPLSMSDDGEKVLFAAYTSQTEGTLYLSDGGVLSQLPVAPAAFAGLDQGGPTQLSGDGSAVLYSTRIGFQLRWHLHRIATGTETVIAAPNGSPLLSRDGSVVVATTSASDVNSRLSIWDTSTTSLQSVDVEGGAGRLLMDDAGTTLISAGYSRIVRDQVYEDYRFELSRIDVATGDRDVLYSTQNDGLDLVAIDTNGDRIVVQGRQPFERRIPVAREEIYGGYDEEHSVYLIDFNGTPTEVPLPGYVGSLDDQMARLYEAYFDRAPDAGGLTFWREQRAGGRSLDSVSDEFARSPEFTTTYGDLGDEAFVDLVYRNVLDRAPDAGGKAFWLDQLANGRTRGSLMTLFSESPEFIDVTNTQPSPPPVEAAVARLYAAVFGRKADEAGLAHWVSEANRGVPLDDIAWYFMFTEEFQNMYGGFETDPYAMLTIVYRNGMDRDLDDEGYALTDSFYFEERPIEELMVQVTNSAEFVALTSSTPIGG